jgi:hypothetical protein
VTPRGPQNFSTDALGFFKVAGAIGKKYFTCDGES